MGTNFDQLTVIVALVVGAGKILPLEFLPGLLDQFNSGRKSLKIDFQSSGFAPHLPQPNLFDQQLDEDPFLELGGSF